MNKWMVVLLLVLASAFSAEAQELNARVTVNSDRVQTTNKEIFTSLEKALTQFINGQKWSTTTFATNERIDCTFTITIVTRPTDNTFATELFVQARRPVYNSSYSTNVLNFRDTKFDFEYMENAPVEFVQGVISNNLVAVISFYCNLILGLDFDSFSPMGGAVFFRQAQSIAMQAQGNSEWTGWTAFDDPKNRHAIITAYSDESLKAYRELWYTYHRKGLDEMTANPDRARTTILTALPVLKEIRNTRGSSILIQMFSDSKLDEVVALAGKATTEEKKETLDLLRSIYPTSSTQLEPLKK